MGLIKSNHAPAGMQPFSMKDVENAAKGILLRARKQAEELIAAAQREGEALKEMARAEGSREGFGQGLAEGSRQGADAGRREAFEEQRAELAEAIRALSAAAIAVDSGRSEMEADALREVVQLAVAIARRVTKRQGLIDESVLAANLAESMKLVSHAADLRIAIHPSQRRTLDEALPQLRAEWPALRHVELIDDPALSPGGCRVFTRHGQIDADLDGQLDRVVADLLPVPGAGM